MPIRRNLLTRRDFLHAALLGGTALAALPSVVYAQTPPALSPAPTGPYTLPALPYAFDALEPFIDARTMQIHHDRHHAAYVSNLNKALRDYPDVKPPIEDLIRGLLLPAHEKKNVAVFEAIRNNGGGHANHTLFWASMKKGGGGQPKGELAQALDKQFGSFAAFQEQMTKAAVGQFGSGWAWLSVQTVPLAGRKLVLEALPNQDSPLMYGRVPLLGVDVWEHAYYLKYQNKRAEYVAAWWNTLDWDAISARYAHSPIG